MRALRDAVRVRKMGRGASAPTELVGEALTHLAKLAYREESKLDESFIDVYGCIVKSSEQRFERFLELKLVRGK